MVTQESFQHARDHVEQIGSTKNVAICSCNNQYNNIKIHLDRDNSESQVIDGLNS